MATINQSVSSLAGGISPIFNLTQNSTTLPTTGPPQGLSIAMDVIFALMGFLILVAMGCTVDIEVMLQHIKRPYGIGVGVLSQFLIMPLLAFLLCLAFQLEPARALSVLVVGCSPGGSISNILAYLVDGDMSLSICMTTASTALAMALMPLCLWLYSKPWTTPQIVIPYWKIAVTLVTIVVPVSLGILLKYKSPKGAATFLKIGGFFGFFILIAGAVLGGLAYSNMWYGPPSIFILAAIFPLIGYTLGYLLAWLFRMDMKCRKTVCIETGNQNIGLGLAILKLTFPSAITGKLLLFPIMYGAFQGMEAVLVIMTYQIWKIKCKEPADEEDELPLKDPDPTTQLLENLTKRPWQK